MLSRLRQFVFRRSTCTTIVDRRLGLEAAEARVSPPPGLRRRTLAALREASLQPSGARAQRRPYALICTALVLIAATAVLYLAAPGAPTSAPRPSSRDTGPLRLLSLDTVRLEAAVEQRLHIGEDSWETPLRQEARLIVADARQAGEYLLARLPRAPGG